MNVIALKPKQISDVLVMPGQAKQTRVRYLDMDKFVSLVVFDNGTSECHMDFGTATLSEEETSQLQDWFKEQDRYTPEGEQLVRP